MPEARFETASAEIDETLRLKRQAHDRSVSRLRTYAVVTILVLGFVFKFGEAVSPLGVNLYLTAYLLFALAMDWYASTHSLGRVFGYVNHAIDLSIIAGFVFFFPGSHDATLRIVIGVIPVAMVYAVMVSSTRGEPGVAIFGATLGTALLIGLYLHWEGFRVIQLYTLALVMLTGVAGVNAGFRERDTLSTLVKLQLLRRFLPAAATEQVLSDPHGALTVGGQTVTATVMVTDLRDFTHMSESLTPEQVVEQLNGYHSLMLEQVEAHGGMLDKFMGDGALIVFGLQGAVQKRTVNVADGVKAAVDCARAMLKAIESLNKDRQSRGLPPLKMGIGIHTGRLVAGNIGAPGRRLEFTIIGDAVNTAARLESATKTEGQPVLISADSVAYLGAQDQLTPLPPVQVKGKAQPIAVFALRG